MPLIKKGELLIHDDDIPLPVSLFKEDDYSSFGILDILVDSAPLSQQPLFLLFTIDRTGSMEEVNQNMISKINQVKQTLKNTIRYLTKQDMTIYICVHVFNDTVTTLINNTLINKETDITEIMQKIDNITADGLTNIGEALQSATHRLDDYVDANPTHQVGHIFMTDGDPTSGIIDNNELSRLVCDKYINTFIGYGNDHNVGLLRDICKNKNTEYLFVDKTENTSIVYGEAIHKFLYPAIKNVKIEVTDGYIYNWNTNEWVTEITESVLVGEVNKIYNIKTVNCNAVCATIYGNYGNSFDSYGIVDTLYKLPALISPDGNLIQDSNDLSKHSLRQKVMELLFKSTHIVTYAEELELQIEIKNVFGTINDYIKTHPDENNSFIRTLRDDLSIVYKTIQTVELSPHILSRFSTQGGQQSYNTTIESETSSCNSAFFEYITPPKLSRHKNHAFDIDMDNASICATVDDNDIEQYIQSSETTTPYATPSMIHTMTELSQPQSE